MTSMDVNLADLVGAVADAMPDRCALVCDGDRLSYRELMDRVSEHGHPRESQHHGILVNRIEQWRGRWDILGILATGCLQVVSGGSQPAHVQVRGRSEY